MKLKILDGALESLELLTFFNFHEFFTSSVIIERFKEIKQGTLYNRLEDFVKQGLLIKLNKKAAGKKVSPGGYKTEYKITKKGLNERVRLIEKVSKFLKSNKESTIRKSKEELIEISEELEYFIKILINDIIDQGLHSIEEISKDFISEKYKELYQLVSSII
ncbi:MAG: hypothetical protein EU535_07785 [Promethearchaeota archaeon]|nr:MAG: hypothetical protein EU535_07785 [Candidatus Lokiarchaeota archaeon]